MVLSNIEKQILRYFLTEILDYSVAKCVPKVLICGFERKIFSSVDFHDGSAEEPNANPKIRKSINVS